MDEWATSFSTTMRCRSTAEVEYRVVVEGEDRYSGRTMCSPVEFHFIIAV
ncbi:MAG: hypothetical protein GY797_23500 [Deltaproteobacteria bacterium]|nr:hypothetical protein [Deltaproteobacteria bacterium]